MTSKFSVMVYRLHFLVWSAFLPPLSALPASGQVNALAANVKEASHRSTDVEGSSLRTFAALTDAELWTYVVAADHGVLVGFKEPGTFRGLWRDKVLVETRGSL